MKTALIAAVLISTTPPTAMKTQEQICAEGGGCYTFTMRAIELMLKHASEDAFMEGLKATKCKPPTT